MSLQQGMLSNSLNKGIFVELTRFNLFSYPRGLVIMIALVLSGLVLVAGQIFIYFFSNRRKRTASEPTELDIL